MQSCVFLARVLIDSRQSFGASLRSYSVCKRYALPRFKTKRTRAIAGRVIKESNCSFLDSHPPPLSCSALYSHTPAFTVTLGRTSKMSGANPTFVVVPGACQPSSVYQPLVDQLGESGYVSEIVPLPSLNAQDPTSATCQVDAEVVHQRLRSLIEDEGRDVILVNHSYGGIPGGGAAYGLAKDKRAADGRTAGVVGIVYMTAFVVPEGTSLLEYLGQHAPYIQQNQVSSNLPTDYRLGKANSCFLPVVSPRMECA